MARISRRRFVQQSAVAASTVFAAPYIARTQDANSKLGACVVGCGGRGGSHIGAYLGDSRTEIVSIVEVDTKTAESRADAIAGKQGFRPKVFTDMREAFAQSSVDLVSTATPNHWHALVGVWAMQAGKDAYIEKPVSHNVWEGAALVAAARKYERMCQVGTQSRSSTALHGAIEFMNEGGIGEVNFARGLCYKRRKSIGKLGNYPIPENVDFNFWSGPATYTDPKLTRERFHYDWHWQRHYGNGDLGNQGPHQTDIARWGLGIDTHPNTIVSYGGRLGYQAERKDDSYVDAGDTPNTIVTVYDYGKKSIVFETRGLSVDDSDDTELNTLFKSTKGNKIGVVFYGSEGYVVQLTYGHCIAYDKDMKVIKEFKGGENHFGNFVSACISRNREELNGEVREGHLSASMAHLGTISYFLGEQNKVSIAEAQKVLEGVKSLDDNAATLDRTVKHLRKNGVDLDKYPIAFGPALKFDPDMEVFIDNKEADRYLTREYREPFVCPTADKV
jgi:predicted dehydrogenase